MFFIPNSSLFNISYVNNNEKIKSLKYSHSDVSEVVINSRAYNINILPAETDEYSVEVYSNSFGFVLTKNKDCSINSNLKNGILTFNIEETHGLAAKNNSYVNLYVPSEISKNLNINNSSATTTIDSEYVTIENLTYSTSSGDFFFKAGKINGLMDLNFKKGKFNIEEEVETNENDVNLRITSGRFNAKKEKLGDIDIIENKNGVLKIHECGSLEEYSDSAGGQIYIDKMSHLEITSSDTIIEVGEITDAAIVTLTKSGKFSVNILQGPSFIITKSGNIFVGSCDSSSSFHTTSGNITVNNAKKTISIKSNSGETVVNFSKETDVDKHTLYATILDGSLTATGVEHIGIDGISITGKGSAFIEMSDVYGENSINGNNGNVKVVVESTSKYILTTSSNSGSVRVNLLQTSDFGGYTDLNKTTKVNCESSDNSLLVSSNKGSITVLDSVIHSLGL